MGRFIVADRGGSAASRREYERSDRWDVLLAHG
jgi:hypothetical protein